MEEKKETKQAQAQAQAQAFARQCASAIVEVELAILSDSGNNDILLTPPIAPNDWQKSQFIELYRVLGKHCVEQLAGAHPATFANGTPDRDKKWFNAAVKRLNACLLEDTIDNRDSSREVERPAGEVDSGQASIGQRERIKIKVCHDYAHRLFVRWPSLLQPGIISKQTPTQDNKQTLVGARNTAEAHTRQPSAPSFDDKSRADTKAVSSRSRNTSTLPSAPRLDEQRNGDIRYEQKSIDALCAIDNSTAQTIKDMADKWWGQLSSEEKATYNVLLFDNTRALASVYVGLRRYLNVNNDEKSIRHYASYYVFAHPSDFQEFINKARSSHTLSSIADEKTLHDNASLPVPYINRVPVSVSYIDCMMLPAEDDLLASLHLNNLLLSIDITVRVVDILFSMLSGLLRLLVDAVSPGQHANGVNQHRQEVDDAGRPVFMLVIGALLLVAASLVAGAYSAAYSYDKLNSACNNLIFRAGYKPWRSLARIAAAILGAGSGGFLGITVFPTMIASAQIMSLMAASIVGGVACAMIGMALAIMLVKLLCRCLAYCVYHCTNPDKKDMLSNFVFEKTHQGVEMHACLRDNMSVLRQTWCGRGSQQYRQLKALMYQLRRGDFNGQLVHFMVGEQAYHFDLTFPPKQSSLFNNNNVFEQLSQMAAEHTNSDQNPGRRSSSADRRMLKR